MKKLVSFRQGSEVAQSGPAQHHVDPMLPAEPSWRKYVVFKVITLDPAEEDGEEEGMDGSALAVEIDFCKQVYDQKRLILSSPEFTHKFLRVVGWLSTEFPDHRSNLFAFEGNVFYSDEFIKFLHELYDKHKQNLAAQMAPAEPHEAKTAKKQGPVKKQAAATHPSGGGPNTHEMPAAHVALASANPHEAKTAKKQGPMKKQAAADHSSGGGPNTHEMPAAQRAPASPKHHEDELAASKPGGIDPNKEPEPLNDPEHCWLNTINTRYGVNISAMQLAEAVDVDDGSAKKLKFSDGVYNLLKLMHRDLIVAAKEKKYADLLEVSHMFMALSSAIAGPINAMEERLNIHTWDESHDLLLSTLLDFEEFAELKRGTRADLDASFPVFSFAESMSLLHLFFIFSEDISREATAGIYNIVSRTHATSCGWFNFYRELEDKPHSMYDSLTISMEKLLSCRTFSTQVRVALNNLKRYALTHITDPTEPDEVVQAIEKVENRMNVSMVPIPMTVVPNLGEQSGCSVKQLAEAAKHVRGFQIGASWYRAGRIISNGAFGLALNVLPGSSEGKQSDRPVVLKLIPGEHKGRKVSDMAVNEAGLHHLASAHPNVVSLLKFSAIRLKSFQSVFGLVMEHGGDKTLRDFGVSAQDFECPIEGVEKKYETLLGYLSEIEGAIAWIHGQGIYHSDIKPSNILIGPGGPKITDFGLSAHTDGRRFYRYTQFGIISMSGLKGGTLQFLCRDITLPTTFRHSDSYAFGVTCLHAFNFSKQKEIKAANMGILKSNVPRAEKINVLHNRMLALANQYKAEYSEFFPGFMRFARYVVDPNYVIGTHK